MPLTTTIRREKGRWNEKEALVEDQEKDHDGAFSDLTKQFKRLSCPFNALKRLTVERRIVITETPCLKWTDITRA